MGGGGEGRGLQIRTNETLQQVDLTGERNTVNENTFGYDSMPGLPVSRSLGSLKDNI